MPSVAKDNSQAQAWCDEARRLLKSKILGTSKRTRLNAAAKDIAAGLAALAPLKGQGGIADLEGRFRSLAGELHDIAKMSPSAKEAETAMAGAIERLQALQQDVAGAQDRVRRREQLKADIAAAKLQVVELSLLNRKDGTAQAPYEQPLADLIRDVEALVNADKNLDQAVVRMATVPEVVKAAKSLAAREVKNELSDAHLRPVYEDKVRRIVEAMATLRPLNGTAKHVAKLQGLLDAGDAAAKSGAYKKAYDALQGLSGTLEEGLKASANFGKSVGDSAMRKQLAATEAVFDTFDQINGVARPDVVAGERAGIDALLKGLDGVEDAAEFRKAEAALKVIADRLTRETQGLAASRRAYEAAFKSVRDGLAALRPMAPTATFTPLLATLRLAETTFGLQDYERAVLTLGELAASVDRETAARSPAYDEWVELSTTIRRDHLPTLDWAIVSSGVMALVEAATAIKGPFGFMEAQLLEHCDFAAATKVAADTIAAMARPVADGLTLAELRASWAGLASARKRGHARLDALRKEVEGELVKLEKKGIPGAGFRASADREVKDRGFALDRCMNTSDLENCLNEAEATLVALRNRLRDPAAAGQIRDEATQKAKQVEFQDLARTMESLIAYLAAEYPSEVVQPQAQLQQLRQAVGKGSATPEQVEAMRQAVTGLQATHDRAKAERERMGRQVKELAASTQKRARKLRDANPEFAQYFDDLEARVKDHVELSHSSVGTLVHQAVVAMLPGGSLSTELEGLETGRPFDALLQRIAAVRQTLTGTVNLARTLPGKKDLLLSELDAVVVPACHLLTPAEGHKRVERFVSEKVDPALKLASEKAAEREQLATDADQVLGLLAGLDLKATPEVAAKLRAELLGAKSPDEGQEYLARARVEANRALVEQLSRDGGAAVDMERMLRENAFKAEQSQKAWLGKVDIFDKNQRREATAAYDKTPGSQRDEGRYAEIGRLEAEARKAAKSGNLPLALAQLDAAIQAAELFTANPYDTKTTSRRALPAAARLWKVAVGRYAQGVNELLTAVKAAAGADAAAVAPAVKMIEQARVLFDPDRFDRSCQALSGDLPLKDHRSNKETALRFVAMARHTLASEPVLAVITRPNPFGVIVPVDELKDRLRNLDLNLQRA